MDNAVIRNTKGCGFASGESSPAADNEVRCCRWEEDT